MKKTTAKRFEKVRNEQETGVVIKNGKRVTVFVSYGDSSRLPIAVAVVKGFSTKYFIV